jgi:catechol 2,3-dioxygenase-like lactoylglutathione lyase family enzyme
VADLEVWIRELEAKGVTILIRPYEIGDWNEAYIEDPNGIWIEFLQHD